MNTDFVRWAADDGIGRTVRNGLNFTERGYGVRGAVGVSDRGNSAASQLNTGRHRLGRPFWQTGRALVPHGRDFRGAFGYHTTGSH